MRNQPLDSLFQERQESFLASLRSVITAMGNDEYMRQMFDDKLSVLYVPDRVCEIVRSILNDEREKYISVVFSKLNAIELCFGEKRSQRLEEVGMQLSDLYLLPIQDINRKRMLMGKVAQLARELMGDLIKHKELPGSVNPAVIDQLRTDTEREVTRLKHYLKKMQTIMSKTFRDGKAEISRNIRESQSRLKSKIHEQQRTIDDLRKQLKDRNEKHEQNMSQLKKRNDELQTSLSKSTSSYRQKHQKAKQIVAKLSTELSNTQKELEQAQSKIKEMHQDNDQLKSTVKKLSDNSQEERLTQSLREISQLKSENERLHALEDEIAALKAQNAELTREMQEKEKTRLMETKSAEGKIGQLTNDLKQAQTENVKLKEALRKIPVNTGKVQSLMRENKELLDRLNSREELLKASNSESQRLKDELQKMEKINEEQAASVESLADKNEQLMSELREIRHQRRPGSQQTEVTFSSECSMDASYASQYQPRDELKAANETIARLRQTISEKDEVIRQSEHAISQLASDIQDASGSQRSLLVERENYEALKIEYESLQEHCALIQEGLERAREEITRLTQANADLYKYKTENEVLQSSSKDIAKELRATKQRLSRSEHEVRKTPAQRKLSEQARDMSKELRDINARISRVVAHASKSYNVTSLEDIPRVLSDAKQDVHKVNAVISKIRTTLDLKADEDVLAAVRRLKQNMNGSEGRLKEVEGCFGVESFQELTKAVADMKSQLSELRSREQRLCELVGANNSTQLLKEVRQISDTIRRMRNVCDQLKIEDESLITEKVRDLAELQSVLGQNIGSGNTETVKKFVRRHTEIENRQMLFMKILGITSERDLEPVLRELVERDNEFINLQKSLGLEENPDKLNVLITSDSVCTELCRLLNVSSYEDIPEAVHELQNSNTEMCDLEDHMMIALAVVTPESIVPKLEELHSRVYIQRDIIQNVCDEIQVKNESEISDKLQSLVSESKDMAVLKQMVGTRNIVECIRELDNHCSRFEELLDEIRTKLQVHDDKAIIGAIQKLLNSEADLETIEKLIPAKFANGKLLNRVKNVLNYVSSCEAQASEIEKSLNCEGFEGIKESIAKIKSDLAATSVLFSKVMSFLTSSDMQITFPIDDAVACRLNQIIEECIANGRAQNSQMKSLMNKASNFGYRGKEISEAVDTIVAACSEDQRRDMQQKMDDELMEIRAVNERLRNSFARTYTPRRENRQNVEEGQETMVTPKSEVKEVQDNVDDDFDIVEAVNKRRLESERLIALQRKQREALIQYACRSDE